MNLDVTVDASEVVRLTHRFPEAANSQIKEFIERVGFKLDREAKVAAPAITGNLRRQIRFMPGGFAEGKVVAGANYSKFVHGDPFHQNQRKRKETPFFTMAIGSSQSFVDAEARKLIPGIMKRI